MLKPLARALGTTVEYLIGASDVSPTQDDPPKAVQIPVLGTIPAGIPMEVIEDRGSVYRMGRGGSKEYFASKIKGDSMTPRYLEGDVVIFLKSDSCDSGDKCAVMVNGCDAAFRVVIKHQEGIMLQSLNMVQYAPKFYSNEDIERLPVRIIGVVKELRGKL